MNNEKYERLINVLNEGFDNNRKLIVHWKNGLVTEGFSITGGYETDTEPGDEDYIGEYAAAVSVAKIIEYGKDDTILIYNDCIEISLNCIPQKILLEDGTVLWEN